MFLSYIGWILSPWVNRNVFFQHVIWSRALSLGVIFAFILEDLRFADSRLHFSEAYDLPDLLLSNIYNLGMLVSEIRSHRTFVFSAYM